MILFFLIRDAIAIMKHYNQKQIGEERFIRLALPEAGAGAEVTDGCFSLTSSTWLIQLAFSYHPGPPIHNGPDPPT